MSAATQMLLLLSGCAFVSAMLVASGITFLTRAKYAAAVFAFVFSYLLAPTNQMAAAVGIASNMSDHDARFAVGGVYLICIVLCTIIAQLLFGKKA